MTDHFDIITALKDWDERKKVHQQETLNEVLPCLRELRSLGVCTLWIEYSGSGDSEFVEFIETEPSVKLNEKQESLIESYVCTLLPDGWEVNDGSEGSLVIDLKSGSQELEHYWIVSGRELHDGEALPSILGMLETDDSA